MELIHGETYHRLEELGPRGASFASTGLADLAVYEGRLADAGPILEDGVAADLSNDYTAGAANKQQILADVHILRGDKAKAKSLVDKAVSGSTRLSVVFPAARVYIQAGEEDRALALASSLGERIQPDPRAYAKLFEGEVYLNRGEVQEALSVFTESQKTADTWLSRFDLGRGYLEAGAFPEAYSEFELCLKRRGEATAVFLDDVPTYRYLPEIYYYMGRAQEGLGSPAAADSYRTYVSIKEKGEPTPLLTDAKRRLEAMN